jgi:peptidoglycan/LPS O-acetylase OafA/YrhL
MKRLELLDYGRFAAALSVVAFHYFFNGISNGKISSITHIPTLIPFAKYGYLGVEFFFMISGYVIFFSANNKTAGQFLVTRAVRIFPAFWVAVVFTSIAAQFFGKNNMSVNLLQFFLNLTMFPQIFGQPYVDGAYWSLHYELKFYFMVFALLFMGAQSQLRFVFLLWPAYILFARISDLSNLPYSHGYYCYFAAGAVCAMRGEKKSVTSLFALLLCIYLCVTYSAEDADTISMSKGVEFSALVIGFVVISQFLFFEFLNSKNGAALKIPGSRLAGGLTYPIYLIHAHFGYMILSKYANDENRVTIYAMTISIVFVIAYLIHQFIEKRLSRVWQTFFSRSVGSVTDLLQSRISTLLGYAYNRISKG